MWDILLSMLFIFAIFSVLGFLIEIFVKAILVSFTLTTRPMRDFTCFLSGPYLPIHGVAALLLYWISSLNLSIMPKLLFLIATPIVVEFIGAAFFFYVWKIRLTDYSDKPFNLKGFICLTNSLFFIALALLFYFYIYPALLWFLATYKTDMTAVALLITFYVIFAVDLLNASLMVHKIRKFILSLRKKYKIQIRYNDLRRQVRIQLVETKSANWFSRYFFAFNDIDLFLIKERERLECAAKKQGLIKKKHKR